jgi:hypothetical protein
LNRPSLGSALRFSQPLSGFLAGRSCVALFHATTVPGILPSELFPHKDRVPLSRSLAPLQLSTGVLKCAVLCLSPLVSPTSTLSRSCLVPPRLWTSFQQAEACFPVVLGSAQRIHLVPPASPASKLSSPCETVPATLGRPSAAGRFSPGFFLPLRSFLLPRLGFSTRPGLVDLSSLLCPRTPVCDFEDR